MKSKAEAEDILAEEETRRLQVATDDELRPLMKQVVDVSNEVGILSYRIWDRQFTASLASVCRVRMLLNALVVDIEEFQRRTP